MKIGILTYWWSEDNYGQLLQCYALQKYLRDAGHDACLIRYDPRNDYTKTSFWRKILKAFNPVKAWRFLVNRQRKFKVIKERESHPRRFNEFIEKNIKTTEKNYHSYCELKEDAPDADVYITGSDQVWNCFGLPARMAGNRIRAFCLDFGKENARKIAWAASFGKTTITEPLAQIMGPLLKKFEYISVREKSGLDLCKKCGVENAEWVPDPTILLPVGVYRSLYQGISVSLPEKPYCFLYLLNNKIRFPVRKVFQWAEENGLDIIYVTGNSRYDKFKKRYATIPEWIYLLDNAECVITNSYHGAIFSLIFQKKFGIIPLVDNQIEMNSRIISLFDLLSIKKKFIDKNIDILQDRMQWDSIFASIERVRISCKLNKIII